MNLNKGRQGNKRKEVRKKRKQNRQESAPLKAEKAFGGKSNSRTAMVYMWELPPSEMEGNQGDGETLLREV